VVVSFKVNSIDQMDAYQWFWVKPSRFSMVRQFSHFFSVLSTEVVQIFCPQMTYLRLRALRFFMHHSAISFPESVADCHIVSILGPVVPMGEGTYTTAIRAHEVGCKTTAMIRTSRTRAVPLAPDFPNPSWESSNDLLGCVDRNSLAGSNGWDLGRRVTSEASSSRRAALHLRWAGALVAYRSASAVRLPATVSRRTFWLGAAFNVGSVRGTGAGDRGAAGSFAGSVGDTNACDAIRAIARFVGCSEGER